MPETLAETALMFAARNFPVGPCCRPTALGCSYAKHAKGAPCKFPGKAPIPYRGVRGYTTDPVKIEQFFRWYPRANVGVAMGRASGHFVIESDGPQGEAFLRSFHLPPTPTVVSARGPHRYLKIPRGFRVKTTHIGQLDIIGDGDQVIGPGSRHVSGHVYAWHEYLSLEEIEPIAPPEPLHLWLVQRGILHVSATPMSPPKPAKRQKSASRTFSREGTRPRLPSGASTDGNAARAGTAGGVPRLELLQLLQDLLHLFLISRWPTWGRNRGSSRPSWRLWGWARLSATWRICVGCIGSSTLPPC